jgi:hypothetical protein
MVMCNSSDTANALANSGKLSLYDRPNPEELEVQTVDGNESQQYITLINGMYDTQYHIVDVEFDATLINSNSVKGHTQFSTIDGSGIIQVQETLGARFLNNLVGSTLLLRGSMDTSIFLLKTIFVGHRYDGSTETISNVRPLYFIISDIESQFDITGATYNITVVNAAAGPGKLLKYCSCADGFSFNISKNSDETPTVESALTEMAAALTQTYTSKSAAEVAKHEQKSTSPEKINTYKKIVYKIILDDDYRKAEFKAGTAELAYKQTKGTNDTIIIADGDVISIDSLISKVMMSSSEIASFDNKIHEDGFRRQYKIISGINSTADIVEVTYYVVRCIAPVLRLKVGEDPYSANKIDPDAGTRLEFDYIFSGKNIDIKSFDLSMPSGLAFLQTLVTTQSMPKTKNVFNHDNNNTVTPGNGPPYVHNTGDPSATPVQTAPINSRSNLTNNKRVSPEITSYASLISRQVMNTNGAASITIFGNPQLLNDSVMNPQDLLNGTVEPPNVITVDTPGVDDSEPDNVLMNPYKIPGFVRINVYMPNLTSKGYNAEDPLYEQFWYQGWYLINQVTNKFSSGEFTQDLKLIAINQEFGEADIGSDASKGQEDTGQSSDASSVPEAEGRESTSVQSVKNNHSTKASTSTVKKQTENIINPEGGRVRFAPAGRLRT